jgi:OOP family OmpA-OmpF porin
MKKNIACALLAALSALCTPATAQWYVAGDLGSARYDIDCSSVAGCDSSDMAIRIAGGYQPNRYVAFELAYFDFGSATITYSSPPPSGSTDTIRVSGFGLSVLGIVPIERFSIYGRFGYGWVKASRSNSLSGTSGTSENENRPLFGLGAGYEFSRNLAARLELSYAVQLIYSEQDVTLTSLGVVYRF